MRLVDKHRDATRRLFRLALSGVCLAAVAAAALPAFAVEPAQWNPVLGQPGFGERVNALVVFDDGTGGGPALYAGGVFSIPGPIRGSSVAHVAKWTGSAWQPVGSNMPLSNVQALAVYDDGSGAGPQLFAAGSGTTTLARWNGTQWLAVPGSPNAWLGTLHVHDFGGGPELYVSGGFGGFQTVEGPTEYIARWNGSQWRKVGRNGLISVVREFATFNAGDGDALYAVGGFAFFGPPGPTVIGFGKFSGSTWTGVAGGFNSGALNALKVFDDGSGAGLALFAAGSFTVAGGTSTSNGGVAANRIARWNGQSWSALGTGLNGVVNALAVFDEDGPGPAPSALFVAGDFTTAGGAPANRIAKWNGVTWSAMGEGANGSIVELLVAPGGDALIAAGEFTSVTNLGGPALPVGRVAAWKKKPFLPADLNHDGVVNTDDLILLIGNWGACVVPPPACLGDIAPEPDGDGAVNTDDLIVLITSWG